MSILPALAALGLVTATAAAGAQAPCVPSTLNNSARLGAVTVSPLPGARDATPATQISLLGVPAPAISAVAVAGTRTGAHTGRLAPYSQGDGASFLPFRPFAEGERVRVAATISSGGTRRRISWVFSVARLDPVSNAPEKQYPGAGADIQSFASRPDLHPPRVTVATLSPAASPGDVFLAPYGGAGQAGPMILGPDGGLLFFQPLPAHVSATNFRVQQFAGAPVLTWWQGDISGHGFGQGSDVVLDSGYRVIARVHAGNGLYADLHEFQLTPRGTALITAYEPIGCDLSSVHGPSEGAVTDGVMQEVDVATGLVRLQWTSLDHVAMSDSWERASTSSPVWPFDFFHINSINLDPDGGLLVSARNTWAIYDIDPATGRVAWRLGGRSSSFNEGPGAATAWQHDPRVLPDGDISIFDNGSSPNVHSSSRGIVVHIDPASGTASLVSQFAHSPPIVAESQGNLQALADGDWFVGWGQTPGFSEFDASGNLLLDAALPAHTQSYRAFRLQWSGRPPHGPSFAATASNGTRTVYASWNGATGVAAWRLLAGPSAAALAPAAEAARGGFETALVVPAGVAGPWAQVQALDASGAVIGSSAIVKAL